MMNNSEQVLVISRIKLPRKWLNKKISLPASLEEIDKLTPFIQWPYRREAETDETTKQLIPYLILRCSLDNTIAIYERKGNEKRLHGLYSVGIGGHINPVDYLENEKLSQTIVKAARREFAEELRLLSDNFKCYFKGIINEEITKVGRVHTGLVFETKLDYKPEPQSELKNMHWVTPKNLNKYKMELWSEMALELL